ncbi:hypothetical protein ACXR2U_20405 [Jatrophihabitans sp. YIM 134969]
MTADLSGERHATTAATIHPDRTSALWRLYVARFVFAALWAATVAAVGGSLTAAAITAVVVYPVVDVLAAVVDLRITGDAVLWANIGVSTLAAIGIAIAAAGDVSAVLRVFGAWAVVSGLVQLVVGVRRRAAGGQLPMMLSGAISVLAGAGFVRAAGDATSLHLLAGYAALGGIFFVVSALLLRRDARGTTTAAR